MPASLTGGAAPFGITENKEFFIRKMLVRATPKLYYNQFANKDYIPSRSGLSVEWRRFSTIAASTTALTEGTAGAETIPTVVIVTATVQQFGQYFKSTDIVQSQAIDDIRAEGSEALGETLGNSYDQLTRSVWNAGTTVQYASTATSRGTVGSGMRMSSAELREAVATLEGNDAVPFDDGGWKAIIHPKTKADLLNDTNFLNAQQYAGARDATNTLFSGKLGRYYGVDFYVSSNAQVGSSLGLSGADVFYTVIAGKDYVGVVDLSAETATQIYHEPGSGGATGDPLSQIWSLGYKFAWAAARLNENFAVRIESTTLLGTGG
jgi:N4-gp56 family major capsid protein